MFMMIYIEYRGDLIFSNKMEFFPLTLIQVKIIFLGGMKRILFWIEADIHWNAVETCLEKSGKNGEVMKQDFCINNRSF